MFVQQRRDGRVFITFALHHMAPVASKIADRNIEQLVFAACAREGFCIPFLPGDGVFAV